MSAIPSKARGIVHERHMSLCARCGMRGGEIHHRQRRREGGHGVGNLVLLCNTDHKYVHANPVEAQAEGYIVSISADNPGAVPIRTFTGWVLFDDVGGIRHVQHE